MAERPGELEEQGLTKVDETGDVALATEKSDDGYLTDLSADASSSGVAADETADAEQIRANIEETRAGMSETIDAIQEKLSFGNISEQVKGEVSEYVNETIQTAKDTVYELFLEKAGFVMDYVNKGLNEAADTQIGRTVRRNPTTVMALIGLGGGVLLVRSFQKKQKYNRPRRIYDYDYEDDQNYERVYSTKGDKSMKSDKSMLTSAQETVSGAAGAVGSTVSSAAGAVSDTVGSAAGAVSSTVSGAASKAYEQVGNLGGLAQDFAGTAQEQYEYYMEENPLVVGAIALAIGAAVGLAIPSTRAENQLMGRTRDNLLQQAKESANEAVEKVQKVAGQVAGQVTETVKTEAQNQGLA